MTSRPRAFPLHRATARRQGPGPGRGFAEPGTDEVPSVEGDALCPRCRSGAYLVAPPGTAHESLCTSCGGRFLTHEGTRQLLEHELGLAIADLDELELAELPGEASCPACGHGFIAVPCLATAEGGVLRCSGCAGLWFEGGPAALRPRLEPVAADPHGSSVASDAAVLKLGPSARERLRSREAELRREHERNARRARRDALKAGSCLVAILVLGGYLLSIL